MITPWQRKITVAQPTITVIKAIPINTSLCIGGETPFIFDINIKSWGVGVLYIQLLFAGTENK
jgi:hypothetical protein